jgi:hypothetical protein
MPMQMPKVKDCTVSNCAYNKAKACHAMAITIGENPDSPVCDTFFESSAHGGVNDVTAGVGACKTEDCSFNKEFECTASDIQVGMKSGQPDCLTYKKR